MPAGIRFVSAATYTLEALADLFTRSFEGYFYPGITSVKTLARRVATEDIDLFHSIVLLVDAEPAGIALLAVRGERAWCGGFGITAAHRGRGYAHLLAAELVQQAREAYAARLTLEVLTRNTAALRVYEQAGLRITRRLLIVAWRPGDEGTPDGPPLVVVDPTEVVMGSYAALHPVRAAWQREPATLLALPELQGLALRVQGETSAYALVAGEESWRIVDLGARDEPAARRLLAGLRSSTQGLTSVNEPNESPLTPAFLRSGFVVVDEQHELELELV